VTISAPPDIRHAPELDTEQVRRVLGAAGARAGRRQERGAPKAPLGNHANTVAGRRRDTRWACRELLWDVSEVKRRKLCGHARVAGGGPRRIRVRGTFAYYAGTQRCGSIWGCPVCSPKIREGRRAEIEQAVQVCLAAGGSVWMCSGTVRHKAWQRLAKVFEGLTGAFRKLAGCRAYRRERDSYGLLGNVKAVEVTRGENGWHPHLHILVFFENTPDPATLAKVMGRWAGSWGKWTAEMGVPASQEHGLDWRPVTSAQEAAQYVAKDQDGKSWVGFEMARSDLKTGREGGVTPFELLDYIRRTGDADALELWHEYENATHGKKAITWSHGLRKRLLDDPAEKSDQELAEEEVDGEDVAIIEDDVWDVLKGTRGLMLAALVACEQGGFEAVAALLAPYGVTPVRP
jgi:hypothetical protein